MQSLSTALSNNNKFLCYSFLQPFCSSSNIFSSSKKLYKCSEIILSEASTLMANKRWDVNCPLRYHQCDLFSTKPFFQKLVNQAIVHFYSNLIQLKSSSFMQVCQFLNPETVDSITFWRFPIRNFPTLLRNYLLNNNQGLLLSYFLPSIFSATLHFYYVLYFHSIYHSKTLDLDLHQIFHYFLGFVHSTQQIVFSDQQIV